MRSVRRSLATVAGLACMLAVMTPVAASAQTAPSIVVENGLTQPVFSFQDAIVERVFVETPYDTDGDGRRDRVRIDLMRPRETETTDFKVPVVLEKSPYRSGTWFNVPFHTDLEPDELPQAQFRQVAAAAHAASAANRSVLDGSGIDAAGTGAEGRVAGPNLPGSIDDYYVPRGYGVIIAQSVGTAQSDGCPTVGDYIETASAAAIVDWLNGRARGFNEAGDEVTATNWATGEVGMIGASYNGTLPNQLATTGIDGLETIVPIVAISDWYDYYRENGLVVNPGGYPGEDADNLGMYIAGQQRSLTTCAEHFAQMTIDQDRVSGDYNEFWDARNYVDKVDGIEASVFVVDGRNDWNVKPNQYGYWWEQLTRHDVTRKIWLHNGGHGTPGNNARYTLPDGTSWTYQQTVHRWFDHELWGVENGIMDEPRAILQRENGTNTTYADFPVPGSVDTRLYLGATSDTATGTLSTRPATGRQATQTFVDNGRNRTFTNLIQNPDQHDANRLVYVTEPLSEAVHLSGTPRVTLRTSIDNADAANLSVYLVDYGPRGSSSATMVTRGWMDPQNRLDRATTLPIRRGQAYDLEFDLHIDDYIFQAGRRIGVVVFSSDQQFTIRPLPGTELTVHPRMSRIDLPIVGGARALR